MKRAPQPGMARPAAVLAVAGQHVEDFVEAGVRAELVRQSRKPVLARPTAQRAVDTDNHVRELGQRLPHMRTEAEHKIAVQPVASTYDDGETSALTDVAATAFLNFVLAALSDYLP